MVFCPSQCLASSIRSFFNVIHFISKVQHFTKPISQAKHWFNSTSISYLRYLQIRRHDALKTPLINNHAFVANFILGICWNASIWNLFTFIHNASSTEYFFLRVRVNSRMLGCNFLLILFKCLHLKYLRFIRNASCVENFLSVPENRHTLGCHINLYFCWNNS